MKLNIDFDFDIGSAKEQLEAQLKKKAFETAKNAAQNLFANHHERNLPWMSKDSDTGILYDDLMGMLTDAAFNEKWKTYAQDYIQQNFQKYLDNALKVAMEHQAKKIAFNSKFEKM